MLNINNNISMLYFHHKPSDCTYKYNHKLYLSELETTSLNWNYDSTTHPRWPESHKKGK